MQTLPFGGVTLPSGADPLPEDVSNGDDDTSMADSPGASGSTVNGMATTPSFTIPRVPPKGSERLVPWLADDARARAAGSAGGPRCCDELLTWDIALAGRPSGVCPLFTMVLPRG